MEWVNDKVAVFTILVSRLNGPVGEVEAYKSQLTNGPHPFTGADHEIMRSLVLVGLSTQYIRGGFTWPRTLIVLQKILKAVHARMRINLREIKIGFTIDYNLCPKLGDDYLRELINIDMLSRKLLNFLRFKG